MLEPEEWKRLDGLLREVLDRPREDRAQWIAEACEGDAALQGRLVELLRMAETDHDLLRPGGALSGISGTGHLVTPGEARRPATTLTPGQRLGRYEILSLLGSGGMGRVYRALDPALGREVAIKALAGTFLDDSASLRRFEREARVLATLSHPNIAAIYGLERHEDAPYLILEKIDGDTLAARLRRGPLPLAEAVSVAIQVADGLEEAHAKGVIHRDLKPSNVMLTPSGRVKVLDFGLAKTAAARAAESGPLLDPTTEAGAILGTAPYMSPEQVHGKEVDTRTDVWAFGCVVYEMLAGRRAFLGDTPAQVLAAVQRDEPDLSALPADVPPALQALLQRCLRKDPRLRLQHIGDARVELLDFQMGTTAPAAAVPRLAGVSRAFLPWVTAALAAATAVSLWGRLAPPAAPPSVRLSLELPRGLSPSSDYAPPFAIAPAGTPVVIVAVEDGVSRLYARELGDPGLRPLAGTEGARQPFFSTDGRWVAFFADRKLKKVPLDGGTAVPLADVGGNQRGAAWAPDGSIVMALSQTSGLLRLPEGASRPAALTSLEQGREYSHRWPEVLPGGRHILFTAALEDGSFDEARLEAVSLEGGERRVVLPRAGFGRYLASGHLAFVRAGRLYRIAFDPERLATRGAPELLVDGVRYDRRNGGAHLAVSASGALVYGPGVPTSADFHLSWVDREGRLARLVDAPRAFRDVRLGPDGRRVAATVGSSLEDTDLWLVDERSTLSRLSFGLSPHRPTWTPDGTRITVGAAKDGRWSLVSLKADGSQEASLLFETPHRAYPNAWTPDGRSLVFQEERPETGWDLYVIDVDSSGRAAGPPRPFAPTPAHESNAVLSPDGRFLAYESDELDKVVQVYLRSFPDGGHKMRVSTAGARWPAWGPGGELYYWSSGPAVLSVVATRAAGDGLALAPPRPVWGEGAPLPPALTRLIITPAGARYDVHPAGGRFLFLETGAPALDPPFTSPVVVLDWAAALRNRRQGPS